MFDDIVSGITGWASDNSGSLLGSVTTLAGAVLARQRPTASAPATAGGQVAKTTTVSPTGAVGMSSTTKWALGIGGAVAVLVVIVLIVRR